MSHVSLARPMTAIHGDRPGWLPRLGAMLTLRRQRLDLAGLSDAQLRDIGVTRNEANAEAGRAAWDAPAHWHR